MWLGGDLQTVALQLGLRVVGDEGADLDLLQLLEERLDFGGVGAGFEGFVMPKAIGVMLQLKAFTPGFYFY